MDIKKLFFSEVEVWLAEKAEECDTDYCSFSPDIIADFEFYRACKIHDHLYRGGSVLGIGRVTKRKTADLMFYKKLLEIVDKQAHNRRHWLLGVVLANFYYFAVREKGAESWKAGHEIERGKSC